jgi:hypothetical protein
MALPILNSQLTIICLFLITPKLGRLGLEMAQTTVGFRFWNFEYRFNQEPSYKIRHGIPLIVR